MHARVHVVAAAALLLFASPALAFEGVLHLDVLSDGHKSRGRVLLRAGGDTRVDVMLPLGARTVNTSLIVLGSNTDVLIHALHDTGTFERRALPAPAARDERFVVEKAGDGDVAGRRVQRFRAVDTKSGDRIEIWIDASLPGGELFGRVWSALRPDAGDLGAALRAAGGTGMPLRVAWDRRHGGRFYVSVVEVSVEPVPREAFDLPKEYREAALGSLVAPGGKGGIDGALEGLGGLFGR